MLAACGNNAGGDVVGKWTRVQTDVKLNVTLEITKNGDSYLVKRTMPSFIDGKPHTNNFPATYKDGILQIPSEMMNYSFDKASGKLTDGKSEYQRVQ